MEKYMSSIGLDHVPWRKENVCTDRLHQERLQHPLRIHKTNSTKTGIMDWNDIAPGLG